MGSRDSSHHLDLRGNGVTTDIVARAINRLEIMSSGESLSLRVDAGEAIDNDLRAWCEATGNHLLDVSDAGDFRTYVIEKGVPVSVVHRLAMVVSSPDHGHLEAPLSLALAAALEGVAVSIFFEGSAVNILTTSFRQEGRRWFGWRSRSSQSEAHHRVRQIHDLGGDLYACERALGEHHISLADLAFDRIIHGEYLTFLPVMEEADIQLLA
ncbi:MAG: sulfurtransferase TusA family protein [Acidimicrobiia bacterium]|nr:sulfurtransferase TusA family protein [Acidimicrobiia bacterium]